MASNPLTQTKIHYVISLQVYAVLHKLLIFTLFIDTMI